jgi:hydrogenase maturation protein HypF
LVPEWLALGATACEPPGANASLPWTAAQGRGAAIFHLALAAGLAEAATQAARERGIGTVVLGGGCFFNRLLTLRLSEALHAAGLRVLRPVGVSCGDAGLALGQAWIAACTVAAEAPRPTVSLKD